MSFPAQRTLAAKLAEMVESKMVWEMLIDDERADAWEGMVFGDGMGRINVRLQRPYGADMLLLHTVEPDLTTADFHNHTFPFASLIIAGSLRSRSFRIDPGQQTAPLDFDRCARLDESEYTFREGECYEFSSPWQFHAVDAVVRTRTVVLAGPSFTQMPHFGGSADGEIELPNPPTFLDSSSVFMELSAFAEAYRQFRRSRQRQVVLV